VRGRNRNRASSQRSNCGASKTWTWPISALPKREAGSSVLQRVRVGGYSDRHRPQSRVAGLREVPRRLIPALPRVPPFAPRLILPVLARDFGRQLSGTPPYVILRIRSAPENARVFVKKSQGPHTALLSNITRGRCAALKRPPCDPSRRLVLALPTTRWGQRVLVPGLNWGTRAARPLRDKAKLFHLSHAARWSLGWHPHLHWPVSLPPSANLRSPFFPSRPPFFPAVSHFENPSHFPLPLPLPAHLDRPTTGTPTHHVFARCSKTASPTSIWRQAILSNPIVGIFSMIISPMSSHTTRSPQDTL
jgi:hypothetical protein